MMPKQHEFMLPSEVAAHFRVDPKTVTRWIKAGRMSPADYIKTPGGHLRVRTAAIRKLLEEGEE